MCHPFAQKGERIRPKNSRKWGVPGLHRRFACKSEAITGPRVCRFTFAGSVRTAGCSRYFNVEKPLWRAANRRRSVLAFACLADGAESSLRIAPHIPSSMLSRRLDSSRCTPIALHWAALRPEPGRVFYRWWAEKHRANLKTSSPPLELRARSYLPSWVSYPQRAAGEFCGRSVQPPAPGNGSKRTSAWTCNFSRVGF